ncbi:hypothetical protein RN001_002043 [Aquatica leii]|uniref:Tesmin/TSO1-like CXC domain-containing protein n=1 Tax=Aquatica leii TaxID=1421715 RepID=A0AAN7Q8B0_9COLE|nr:hypothetical protein RN001_002043 [Aquatica leii]
MRKTMKSAIYDCFQSINGEVDCTNAVYIIDGGYLLHHVVWDREETFNVIFEKYVRYLHRHYGHTVTVVFDGYSDTTKSIKAAEQRRRTTKTTSSSDIIFDEFMKVPANQQQFFANIKNKSRFISMLSDKLTIENIAVKQAQNDADVLIIETAIEKFIATNTTIVVGEDVDLLVLLTAKTPSHTIIYFLKPGKAQQRSEIYSSKSLSAYPKCQNYILFLHATTGCDTKSAMFRRGKNSVLKLFEKKDLVDCAKVFTEIDSSPQTIITKGIQFLLAVYGAPKKNRLHRQVRIFNICEKYKKQKAIYYQVQTWEGNQLNPEDWGWKLINNTLELIQTLLPPAPEKLLNTIFCNCKKGCSTKFGCKKVGLQCSSACTNCQGLSCSNVQLITTEEDSYDFEEETTDSSSFEQFLNIQQEEEEEKEEEEEEEEEIEENMIVEVEYEEFESD